MTPSQVRYQTAPRSDRSFLRFSASAVKQKRKNNSNFGTYAEQKSHTKSHTFYTVADLFRFHVRNSAPSSRSAKALIRRTALFSPGSITNKIVAPCSSR